MPTEIWGREFREQNLASKYPFSDASTLVADSGLAFGSDVIVDAVLHPIGSFASLNLTAVEVALSGVTLWIGHDGEPRLASCGLDPRAAPGGAELEDALGRPVGAFVFNPPSALTLQTWPLGVHEFAPGTAEFVASTLIPTPEPGVRGFLDEQGALLTDDVWIVGNGGVATSFEAPDVVRLHAVGDPLFKRAACLESGPFTAPVFLKSINGVGPDAYGGFLLAPAGVAKGKTILRIEPSGDDGLVISLAGPTP